jgi:hypothetical protein
MMLSDQALDVLLKRLHLANTRRAWRDLTRRAERKASWVLEDSMKERPSRKSTRKATNRQRTDSQMRVKLRTQEARPSRRATMRPS